MTKFNSFIGKVTNISNFRTGIENTEGCYKFITLQDNNGNIVNFIMTPYTFLVDYETISVGDIVEGFYDAMAPAVMIYPPQYEAIVMTKVKPNRNVKVDYFDEQLVSSDGTLRLNIAPNTKITMQNGQNFTNSITNKNLVVVYGPSTKSIPAQTTPYEIVVLCRNNQFN
ncbi:hypothetical protein KHQ81_01000 [Mycoplasmatota bacterium]|nr:hypothetical protein KHQ81_01000 [Mycoplasmatota bacterium]